MLARIRLSPLGEEAWRRPQAVFFFFFFFFSSFFSFFIRPQVCEVDNTQARMTGTGEPSARSSAHRA